MMQARSIIAERNVASWKQEVPEADMPSSAAGPPSLPSSSSCASHIPRNFVRHSKGQL